VAEGRGTIVITTSSFGRDHAQLQRLGSDGWRIVFNPHGRRLTEHEAFDLLNDTGAIAMVAGVEPLTRTTFEKCPNLRIVSRCGIGLDSVDLAAAEECEITVVNTPDAPAVAVAELTMALLLATARKVTEADRNMHEGIWTPLMGSLVNGTRVGVVGLGRVGTRVSTLTEAFGASVSYYDPLVDSDRFEQVDDLRTLAARSDFLTVHVPLVDATRHLIDQPVFHAMPDHAILINTSRGGVVDEAALAVALETGSIAAAAIDVFEREPYDGPLCWLPNAVLTSHMGSYARQARRRMESEALDNLIAALAGS
jgi:D-3-phosphoglycerate dehydrogenase